MTALMPDAGFPKPIIVGLCKSLGVRYDYYAYHAQELPDGDVMQYAVDHQALLLTRDECFPFQPKVPALLTCSPGIVIAHPRGKQWDLWIKRLEDILTEYLPLLRGRALFVTLTSVEWRV